MLASITKAMFAGATAALATAALLGTIVLLMAGARSCAEHAPCVESVSVVRADAPGAERACGLGARIATRQVANPEYAMIEVQCTCDARADGGAR